MASELQKGKKKCQVLEIDPDETKLKFIENTATANNLQNYVKTFRFGLSDTISTGALDKSMHAGAWFVKEGQDFALKPLDDIISNVNGRFYLLKLDIEGLELKALRGSVKIIKKHHPLIMVEMSSGQLARYGDSLQDIRAFMDSLGYEKKWSGGMDELYEHRTSMNGNKYRKNIFVIILVVVLLFIILKK